MAIVNHPVVNPFALKTATATFTLDGAVDSDNFSDHIGTLTLVPASAAQSWTSINGKTIQDASAATWAAQLGLVQDLDESGFSRWLLAHEGERATAVFTFKTGADTVTIEVILTPAQFGGTADGTLAQATVTLPCDGKPVWS